MKNDRLSKLTTLATFLIVVASVLIRPPHNILSYDIFGYYLYLPTIFIYHDPGMQDTEVILDIIDKYEVSSSFYQAWRSTNGNWVIKYTCGSAVLFLPFFLVGHGLTLATGGLADGFSPIYQWAIIVGCFFYLACALFLLRKALRHFVGDKATAITIPLLLLSTNFWMTYHPGCANVHFQLFFLYALLLWFTIRWHEKPQMRYMVGIAIAVGMILITRPTDVICLLIPLLWNVVDKASWTAKWSLLKSQPKQMITPAVIVLLICSVQMVYWKFASGHFIINSYRNPGEGMDFFRPHILETLFSFRKGWFIYTPIMLIASFGFICIYQNCKKIFWPLFAFFVLNIYLVSAWSCWWYADSFGQRAYIQSYSIMAFPLAFLIQQVMDTSAMYKKVIFWLGVFAMTVLNLFQSWQMYACILDTSRMTAKAYKSVFLKTQRPPDFDKLLLVNRNIAGTETLDTSVTYQSKILYRHDAVVNIASDQEYAGVITTRYRDITRGQYAWIRVTAEVFADSLFVDNPMDLVCCFERHGHGYKSRYHRLADDSLQTGQWQTVRMDYLTPEVRSSKDDCKVYFWHRGTAAVSVRNITVTAYMPVTR